MIRWGGGKMRDWEMNDVACHDMTQAEQYIATIALHALTFPSSEGFASGTSSGNAPTSFRLLPSTFRELWDELEANRKSSEDATNRSVWAKLRSIVEAKLDRELKVRVETSYNYQYFV